MIRIDVLLTERAILAYIAENSEKEITHTDIAVNIGCCRKTVNRHILRLKQNNYIDYPTNKRLRYYVITPDGLSALENVG